MKKLRDKVAVITGAASGFGRELARLGAKRGMKLVLADIQQEALDAVRRELEASGAQVLAMRCDVRKEEEVQALANGAMDTFGAVHLLFNNAGVGIGGLVWEHTAADWEWVLGVNLWGVVHGVRIFMPLMLACAERDVTYRGHIVNTASMAGLLNAPNMGIYNVSKHAVVSLSETLYHDLLLVGAPIGASVLCPYFTPTGIDQSSRHRPPEVQDGAPPTASQRAAQRLTEKAVSSGTIDPAQVAENTFDAIGKGEFYIYSHPQTLKCVQVRMEDIVQGRNPSDPYQDAPHIRAMLLAHLHEEI